MKLGKIFAAVVLSLSLIFFAGTSFAAPAWKLPAHGKIFANAAEKSAYIDDYAKKFFAGQIKTTFAVPDGWTHEKFSVNGVAVERLTNPKQKKSNRVALQFHGGGYVDGLGDLHRILAVKQAVLTRAREIWLVDYRLAPQNFYPAALDDAAQVYAELLRRGVDPKKLVVFGDSAGGNLALELSIYLREKNLPQPAALILASPWTTFETNLPSRIQNVDRDKILGSINPRVYNEVCNPSYAGDLPLNDPRLSPIHADLSNLPPILIQVGGEELFLDEGVELLKKSAADGLNVTLTVYAGMSHDFAVVIPELDDTIKSFAEIKNFVAVNVPK